MTENERLKELQKELKFPRQKEFAEALGIKQGSLSDIYRSKKGIGVSESIKRILNKEYSINIEWFETGIGEKFNTAINLEQSTGGKQIPFYDDVASIGGNNDMVANVEGVTGPTDYIDTGDWFREATAAIRHYGDSMPEYPNGCILAIKEVYDRELIIPGRDYVIETSEYRVTKRVQNGQTKDYLRAYSSNKETYPDGKLVHEPFDIPWRAVSRISLVLGYVVKKNGGTMIFSNSKK